MIYLELQLDFIFMLDYIELALLFIDCPILGSGMYILFYSQINIL